MSSSATAARARTAIFAIVTALIFGVGFGRVLQLVYGRAWGLELPERLGDQGRFAWCCSSLFGLIARLLRPDDGDRRAAAMGDRPSPPAGSSFSSDTSSGRPVPDARQLAARDLVASSALTSVGIVVLMLVSSLAMAPWIDLYAKDFSGLGVFMALFFWLGLSASAVLVACAGALARPRRSPHVSCIRG